MTGMRTREEKRECLYLGILLAAAGFVVYGAILLTGKRFIYLDVGSDTLHSFYSIYCWAAERLRAMDFSLWSFEIGTGGSIFNYMSVLADPFALPVLVGGALFGVKVIAGLLVWVQLAKIFCAGFLCLLFLRCFRVSSRGRVLASFCYGFNGFLILWGQHYWLGTASVWIILELLWIERAIRGRRISAGMIATTAWMLMQSPYIGYMTLLFAGFYALFRLLWFPDRLCLREFLKGIGRIAVPVLLGIAVSAVIFVPVACLILKVSNRLESGMGPAESFFYYLAEGYAKSDYVGIVLRILSNNAQGIGSDYILYQNYYEAPQFFFSSGLFLYLPQLVWRRMKRWKKEMVLRRRKWTEGAACVLLLFLILSPAGSLIFNAFAYPFGRYTFVLMPVFAVGMACAETYLQEYRVNLPLLGLSAFLEAALYIWAAGRMGEESYVARELMLLLAGSAAAAAAGMAIAYRKGAHKRNVSWGWILLSAAVFFSVTADSYCTTNIRGLAGQDIQALLPGEQSDTRQALDYIRGLDSGMYRVEKAYTEISEVMDSMALVYPGVSGYNSMLTGAMQRFHEKLWPQLVSAGDWFRQYYTNVSEDWIQSTLLGVKYLLTKEETAEYGDCYETLGKFGQVTVLRNTQVDTIGYLADIYILDEQLEAVSQDERADLIARAVVVDALKEDEVRDYASAWDEEGAQETKMLWEKEPGTVSLWWDGRCLSGDVQCQEPALLFLSVPYEPGWSLYVDGQETEIWALDYGYSGAGLTEGSHTIRMEYRPMGLTAGVGISAMGMLASAALLIWQKRRK